MIQVATTATNLPRVGGLTRAARDGTIRGVVKWSRDRSGIGIRFSAAAFGLYGFARRSFKYAKRHPDPFVHTGKFRDGVLNGTGCRVASTVTGDAFVVSLVVPAARALNFGRGAGMYQREWARLYSTEAERIDMNNQAEIEKAVEAWSASNG